MAKPVSDLIARLGFDYEAAPALWRQALTHRSSDEADYERLEYLGDAVLKLVVSEWLYDLKPEKSEGEMSKVRARAVSDEVLANVALSMNLGDHLVLGASEKRSKGRTKVGTLASAFEALLGVVHMTAGYAEAKRFLETWLATEYQTSLALGGLENYRGRLQELTQKRYKQLPTYKLTAEIGPENDRIYEMEVWVDGSPRGTGRGRSKKSAEQQAAQAALAALEAPAP